MLIRAGYRLAFECAQPTPTLLVLNVHPSRRADLLSADVPRFDPPLEMWGYIDGFGNACSRVVMPAGRTTISTEFEIYDHGLPDVIPRDAVQHEIKDLPDEVLVFLLGSRYCDTDRLGARPASVPRRSSISKSSPKRFETEPSHPSSDESPEGRINPTAPQPARRSLRGRSKARVADRLTLDHGHHGLVRDARLFA